MYKMTIVYSLHKNLTEHLNAEICLGAIDTVTRAMNWYEYCNLVTHFDSIIAKVSNTYL